MKNDHTIEVKKEHFEALMEAVKTLILNHFDREEECYEGTAVVALELAQLYLPYADLGGNLHQYSALIDEAAEQAAEVAFADECRASAESGGEH